MIALFIFPKHQKFLLILVLILHIIKFILVIEIVEMCVKGNKRAK